MKMKTNVFRRIQQDPCGGIFVLFNVRTWIRVVSVPPSAVLSNKVVVIVILSSSTQGSSGREVKSMIFLNLRHECWKAEKAHWPFDLLCVLNKHQMVDIQHIHYLRAWSVVPAANSHRVPLQACNWTARMRATLSYPVNVHGSIQTYSLKPPKQFPNA